MLGLLSNLPAVEIKAGAGAVILGPPCVRRIEIAFRAEQRLVFGAVSYTHLDVYKRQ